MLKIVQGPGRSALALSLIVGLLSLAGCTPAAKPQSPDSQAPDLAATTAQSPVTDPASGTDRRRLQQELATVVGDRVLFDTDHWDLTTADQEILRRQAAWLQQHGQLTVIISGHGDERGTRDYNLALGERRATAASAYLVALGIDHSRLTVISYGKERPPCAEASEACWAQSRRAVTEIAAP
jgi:peptidoglycan-associated lipoprotein